MTNANPSSRRWLVWLLRVVVLAVVAIAVRHTVENAFSQLSGHDWHVRPGWIAASGAVYAIGLVPMGWFWWRTLAVMRCPTPLLTALSGYFLGHLGKYVPGKAMAVIFRVAVVKKWVPSMRIALASVLLETMTMMAVGAALAAVLCFAVLRSDAYIWLIAAGMAIASGVPTLPPVVKWLARFGAGRWKQDDTKPQAMSAAEVEESLGGINFRLLAEGWCAAAVCWLLAGISLWLALCAIGVDHIGFLASLPAMITAAAFSVVAGFLSMLPGGILVRDAALMQLLVPICGDANALVAAVLIRVVWLVSEVVACGILYVGAGSMGRGAGSKNLDNVR